MPPPLSKEREKKRKSRRIASSAAKSLSLCEGELKPQGLAQGSDSFGRETSTRMPPVQEQLKLNFVHR